MEPEDLPKLSVEDIEQWAEEHDKFDRAREVDTFIEGYINARRKIGELNRTIQQLRRKEDIDPVISMGLKDGTVKAKVVRYLADKGVFSGDHEGVSSDEIVCNVDANPSTVRSAISELHKESNFFEYPEMNQYRLAPYSEFQYDRGFGQYD
jgi:hypothetical protein